MALIALLAPASAWAEGRDLAPGQTATVRGTDGDGLKVRSGPGPSFDILDVAPEGTRVTVLDGPRSNGNLSWYQVQSIDDAGARIRGWVAGSYLVAVDVPAPSASQTAPASQQTTVQGTAVSPLSNSGSAFGPTAASKPLIDPAKAIRVFQASVTGYVSGVGGTGWYTATGTRCRWGTVAVDPKFIALGSRMLIDGLDGVFTAEDVGGAVHGAILDVWFPDLDTARRWNTRTTTVRILREGY
jgi:3D (Asp-Asp-Asp) domain-containing protein